MSSTVIQVESENGKILNIDLANENLSWEVVETDDREMGVERYTKPFWNIMIKIQMNRLLLHFMFGNILRVFQIWRI